MVYFFVPAAVIIKEELFIQRIVAEGLRSLRLHFIRSSQAVYLCVVNIKASKPYLLQDISCKIELKRLPTNKDPIDLFSTQQMRTCAVSSSGGQLSKSTLLLLDWDH